MITVLNTGTREEAGFLCKGGERNVTGSLVRRIALVTKEVSPLLSCVHNEHGQHGNYVHSKKHIHMLRIAQIRQTAL